MTAPSIRVSVFFVKENGVQVVPLGAGQDVGRSCILVSIGGKNVMLDCGMHMGYQDERRFPDFSFVPFFFLFYTFSLCRYISGGSRLTDFLDCVIISHFHLDHCGSLPHMSEVVGYDGKIYMTYPTKAIVPVLLVSLLISFTHSYCRKTIVKYRPSSEAIPNSSRRMISKAA